MTPNEPSLEEDPADTSRADDPPQNTSSAPRGLRRRRVTRLDRWWMARPGSAAAVRWAARAERVPLSLNGVLFLLAAMVLLPAGAVELRNALGQEDGVVWGWLLGGWALMMGSVVVAWLLLSGRARAFDVGFVGGRTLPRGIDAPIAEGVPARAGWRALRFTLVAAVGLGAFYLALGLVLQEVAPELVEGAVAGGGVTLMIVFARGVSAPLGEELLFRSLVYPAFRQEYGVFLGAVLHAALFALLHAALMGFSVMNLNHFLGGLVFAFAYERTGSIWPAVALHALGNGSLLLLQSGAITL